MNLKYFHTLLAALFLICLGSAGIAQEKKPAKPAPVITESQAKAYFTEILPLVEQAAGRKFVHTPRMKLVTGETVVPILAQELVPQLAKLMPNADEETVRWAARATAEAYSKRYLGKYATRVQVLFIVPKNICERVKMAKVDSKQQEAFIKLTIAHELAHALQDQYTGLARLLSVPKTEDALIAASSTIEGHAVFTEEKVAKALGLEENHKEFVRLIGAADYKDAYEKIAGAMETKFFQDTYLAGRDFIAWQAEKGGLEQIWHILLAPPAKSSMILHPESYAPAISGGIDYKAALNGVEKKFAKRQWHALNMEAGEMQLRALYSAMDPAVRDAALADYEHVQVLGASSGTSMLSVGIFVFKSQSTPSKLIQALEDMTSKNIKALSSSKKVKMKGYKTGPFTALQSAAGTKSIIAMTDEDGTARVIYVRAARGRVMLEIFYSGIDVSDTRVAEIADYVFKKLPKEMTASK